MNKVAILTDFAADEVAYSIRRVAHAQARILYQANIAYKVFVRGKFNPQEGDWPGAEFVFLNPGLMGENIVKPSPRSEQEINYLAHQMRQGLEGCSIVLAHDLNFAANMWKYKVAASRIAPERQDLSWYLWIHSGGGPAYGAGKFTAELQSPLPNSTLIVLHEEELYRKCALFGYEPFQAVIVPNPVDFTEDYHPAALELIEKHKLWNADAIAVYPCRLDRTKQPHVVVEIFAALRDLGWDARVIIVDFHSTTGDKADYRNEIKDWAKERNAVVYFTSDLEYPGAKYQLPHKAVMDLLDFGDVLVDPSKTESDPLIVLEAAWKRCGLVLNFDHTVFRLYQGKAIMARFSSDIDVTSGMPGYTKPLLDEKQYPQYINKIAGITGYLLRNNPLLNLHIEMRQTRSLHAVWRDALGPLVMRHGPFAPIVRTKNIHGPVSIVIPCWLIPDEGDYGEDELFKFTQSCVKSIREYMPDAELILVDNGSIVHADWLEKNADVYIRNEENLGYAPAVNQGLKAAKGDWLIACNNDVEFLFDWASKAIDAWDEKTGIICSHMFAHDPHMRVGREVPPDPAGYFNGSCWMISRAIYEEVGGLDEGYKFGMFDDKSLVKKIVATGRQLIKIGHIKHIQNATWGKLPKYGIDTDQIYAENKAKYEHDWGV